MKKLIIGFLFLTILSSSIFCFGAIGIEGGFNGYNFETAESHNNRIFGCVSYKPSKILGPFDLTFSIGGGSTSFGYAGFSVAGAVDSWSKPMPFGKIPVNVMNWVWGYGFLFSFGSAYYFLNGDGNQKVYEFLPRFLLGYRYLIPNKKIELLMFAYFEAGVYYTQIDAHWVDGAITKGFGKEDFGFDWDIPIHAGIRIWFNGKR